MTLVVIDGALDRSDFSFYPNVLELLQIKKSNEAQPAYSDGFFIGASHVLKYDHSPDLLNGQ